MRQLTDRTAALAAPLELVANLRAAGIPETDTPFLPLRGGRTNRLWRFGRTLGWVCKLYAETGGTPLFPNDPTAEAKALAALSGSGLAPEPGQLLCTVTGMCLIYRYVEGTPWAGSPREVGSLMARLHRHPAPKGLRRLTLDPSAILQQGDRMLVGLPGTPARLHALRPTSQSACEAEEVFLHGDIVPGNILDCPGGPCLIDWQCPAIGDPTEDIAIFLSPAMQYLYGRRRLSPECEQEFLAGYGNPERADRYRRLKAAFGWRMAAYCLWKAARGAVDYAEAAKTEILALEQFGQPKRRQCQ